MDTGAARDNRTLGVADRGLTLRWDAGMTTHSEHRFPSLSEGWHGDEPEFRWTRGEATIPLIAGGNGGVIVDVDVAMTGGYPLPVEPQAEASQSHLARAA